MRSRALEERNVEVYQSRLGIDIWGLLSVAVAVVNDLWELKITSSPILAIALQWVQAVLIKSESTEEEREGHKVEHGGSVFL